jgi:hypothetical protein
MGTIIILILSLLVSLIVSKKKDKQEQKLLEQKPLELEYSEKIRWTQEEMKQDLLEENRIFTELQELEQIKPQKNESEQDKLSRLLYNRDVVLKWAKKNDVMIDFTYESTAEIDRLFYKLYKNGEL